ncbi:hypothetical protein SODALDRAFT_175453 [Sodiomyces alkalinus F11]|uniref:C2H2-type domain-containing protein n=1 Tax=Sodiomyces alkalinus (strain CBS 110278 / VKM F-3762 / F11) TaxID=1314773 RepID=A0A3N2PTK4_SODAK|nr:hypothetical protein SODALDRAFT_175453 [Sodiomyces alkalinus F11]ROT37840.1 hypothetical protein SODALDRAFT_175453 [Sodiomyces alkalinus F11]
MPNSVTMAATFRPVNTRLAADAKSEDTTTTSPATPRSSATSLSRDSQPLLADDPTTPTRASFASDALASQKPLPSSPFPDTVQLSDAADKSAKHAKKSLNTTGGDMEDSDGETAPGDEGAVSEGESANGDGSKSGKKKKSQRFYCTDYPPCNLSFTRSEHLARHIRKHTGERPFQCHCSRRFSRLDNLRQHAQTVHVNEDIPIDSLAATGARFQRQIRTDRVRQIGGRPRPPTAGSGTGVRGHSKSLSTSSVGSVSSVGSFASSRDDLRRRPPPLVMADPRARPGPGPGLEGGHHRPADGSYMFRPVSPTDYSTPTSATFSTGQSSPRWGSAIVSPTTSHSRSQSMYSVEPRTPGRRLSVPSAGGHPFQTPHGAPMNRSVFGPGAMNSSNSGAFSPATSSVLGSPPTPLSSWSGRRDSSTSVADEVWKRRTWHPESRGFQPTTSSYPGNTVTAPYQPAAPQLPTANASKIPQAIRLPGIESFDPLPPRPASPPRRNPSPMVIDSEPSHPPPALHPGTDPAADERRNVPHWDMGLRRGLTRLDLRSSNVSPPRDSASHWANEADQAVQAQAERARANAPTVRFELDPRPARPAHPTHPAYAVQPNSNAGQGTFARNHQYTMSAPSISTPRDAKRHGWYHGPINGPGQASAEQGQDGRGLQGSHVDRIMHPNITAFGGFPGRDGRREAQAPSQQHSSNSNLQQAGDRPPNAGSSRFDALVAVAASEGSTAAAY